MGMCCVLMVGDEKKESQRIECFDDAFRNAQRSAVQCCGCGPGSSRTGRQDSVDDHRQDIVMIVS